jgi:tetratricopeptide (TPR) repeat protein
MTKLAWLVPLVALVASTARADTPPNTWDAFANPARADHHALHVQVRQLAAAASMKRDENSTAFLNKARVLLREAHAETSDDVVLQFDVGEICQELHEYGCAIDTLERALAKAPDHPAAEGAYDALATAYAKLDRSSDELRVYDRSIARITNPVSVAVFMLNRAEAYMHLGRLDEAIAEYTATANEASMFPNQVEQQFHTAVLAWWGLAVALDRVGDVAGGAAKAKFATELDHDMRVIATGENVFFVPERERDWYVALGFIEYAKQAADPEESAALFHRAEDCWRDYIDDVKDHGEHDRWVRIAKARLESTHQQRVLAEKRARRHIVYPMYRCIA